MANPLHNHTVQEAVNFESFTDWYYQELDLSNDTNADTVTAVTATNPAKKVVLYNKPGSGSATMEADDILTLTINGETGSKLIKIDATDLPFTISGLLMTSLTVTTSDNDSNEAVSVLTFH